MGEGLRETIAGAWAGAKAGWRAKVWRGESPFLAGYVAGRRAEMMRDFQQEDMGDVSDHYRDGLAAELREMQEEYNRGVNASVDHYFIPKRRQLTRKQLIEAAIAVAIVGASIVLAVLLASGGR